MDSLLIPLQVRRIPDDVAGLSHRSPAPTYQTRAEISPEQQQLSDTQAALQQALQQLEELAGSSNDMQDVHAKLEQQSKALQTMQETFDVQAEKAQEHQQSLCRSGRCDFMHGHY